ncbi:MAG: sugar ABC transporter substrate-binding protein [Acidimicrobiia bacterium]|nr:sugar ABC transporter substrate-binding protein [bacterium]MXW57410.1 sugar ABC transporter substrate-binding protein [Acidimicrobiia bacterium]MXZ76951.1 sugar ABC transporter substrate-binding protein [Acidimicrobiia bacterium]MXZ86162.1 sugar ABC transporter substrate-binding protein [Acidimicrobiia bacterium]MYB72482.1 sugar ABC transporter substrate-binding protein [Acidimicrobiia bacterium]
MKRSLWKLLAALLALTLVVAACGNDDDDAAEPAPAPATEAPAPAATEAPAPAATEAPAPEPTEEMAPELPHITVGYLQWIYADEAGKRIEDAAKEAVLFLGWDYETCDAAGDPAQMPVCGNQLLDADIDVMLTDGIPEAFITDVLERAEAEGVPVLSAGGEVDPRNFYIASFASDDTDLGVQLANYLVEQLPDGGNIIVQTVPTAWSDKRITGLNSVIEGTGITVVDQWEGDFANLVAGTEADVTTKLQQYDDVDAVWINFSVASIGAASAIGALYPDGDDPDRPLLVTFYANPTTVNDIRDGRVDAAVDEKLEWQSWAQVDAVAELLAFGTQPSQERAPSYDGRVFSVRQVVTIDTVNAMPADSTEVPAPDPPGDYEEYFRNKWCSLFSGVANCG